MTGIPPRFRQSYAKTLIDSCPAKLRRDIVQGRRSTKAMDGGSLVDMLVFGKTDRFEVVDARYRSGPREGQPAEDWTGKDAREQADEIRARGLLPVLQVELERAQETADAINLRVSRLIADIAGDYPVTRYDQQHVEWTSQLGIECEGTPDIIVIVAMRDVVKVCTIDVKHTGFMNPKRFSRQVYDQCWDVQGAAYREGAVAFAEEELDNAFHLEHWLVCTSSIEDCLPAVARALDPIYLAVGQKRWEKAQLEWKRCLDSDTWPGYDEGPVRPSHFVVRTLEEYDATEFEEEP